MNIKKYIPNFLTCCNLLCGCLGIIFTLNSPNVLTLFISSYFIFAACIFDFFDGFAARLLKVTSPIGKELDSLADVVSFGVLPGLIIYQLLGGLMFFAPITKEIATSFDPDIWQLSFFALLIPIFSALRLAKFNIDTRQSDSFIGVPTPTNAILVASFPLIISSRCEGQDTYLSFPMIIDPRDPILYILLNPYFLLGFTLIMSFLLVSELPLFALKFKSFKWADNKIRFSFLGASLLLFIFLTWTAIPVIIFLYIFLSIIENKFLNPKANS